eukprot:jgi/Antlo1/1151/854
MDNNKSTNLPRDFKNTFLHQNRNTAMCESTYASNESLTGSALGGSRRKTKLVTPEVPRELEKNNQLSNYFDTSLGLPPFSTTSFSVTETGNSDPNIVRSTMYVIPHSNYLLESMGMPLMLMIHPFSPRSYFKEAATNTVQCMQCFSYFNPFSVTLQTSKGFRCNICNCENNIDVPDKPHSTVEYRTKEEHSYAKKVEAINESHFFYRQIDEPLFVFVIELSRIAYSTNFYFDALNSIEKAIDDEGWAFRHVSFLIFTEEMSILVAKHGCIYEKRIHDMDDVPFASPDICFDVTCPESRKSLFETLRTSKPASTVYPISKIVRFVTNMGGFYLGTKVAMFLASSKNSQDLSLYSGILVDNRVSISTFSIVENQTLDCLVYVTNGRSHVYRTGSQNMYMDLCNTTMEKSVYGANVTVKTSDALGKRGIFGNGLVEGANSITFSHMDTKTTAAFAFFIDEILKESQNVYFQIVVSYWKVDGVKRTLVCNLSLYASTKIPLIYNNVSFDTVFCAYVKSVVHDYENWRANLKKAESSLVETLGYYRKKCCENASPSHLHLPESIKLLPALYQALQKNTIFNTKISPNRHKNVLGMDVLKTFRYFYPRLFLFTDFFIEQKMESTRTLKLSYEVLEPAEVYILENGEKIFVYFGRDVCDELRSALRSDARSDERDMLRVIVDELCFEYCCLLPVFFVEQGQGGYELDFNSYLVEDRLHNHPSYEDFIYELHHKVKKY